VFGEKKLDEAGHQWLTPVILVIQEAEIRRIIVQSQPRQIVCEIPISKKPITRTHTKPNGLVWLKV
jgi:hypothetical protein